MVAATYVQFPEEGELDRPLLTMVKVVGPQQFPAAAGLLQRRPAMGLLQPPLLAMGQPVLRHQDRRGEDPSRRLARSGQPMAGDPVALAQAPGFVDGKLLSSRWSSPGGPRVAASPHPGPTPC